MVAVVTSGGLGLDRSSANILGGLGLLGQAGLGRAGDSVYVNAANGNLVISSTDEMLFGTGKDAVLASTYNSQGLLNDDNGDNWRSSASRTVAGLTGTYGTAGSTITRTDWDGSRVVFAWDAAHSAYIAKETDGAYDTLTLSGSTWTWTNGDTQAVETYDNASSGRILTALDRNGQGLTFSYSAGLVSRVTTQTGEYTNFVYSGSNLVELDTFAYASVGGASASGSLVQTTRVRYGYDASNRLSTVTVDLTPADNAITDGKTYVTTYGYDGTSNRVASITQSDGSSLQIAYDASARVQSVTQAVSSGVSRTTSFDYSHTGQTWVTDPTGQLTKLSYDASGQLTQIDQAPAVAGGSDQITSFTYDATGNVLTKTLPGGQVTTYQYDANGNRTFEQDALGNTVARTYGPPNALAYSQAFQNPAWQAVLGATATDNQVVAPDNSTTAATLTFGTASGSRLEQDTLIPAVAGQTWTGSVWLKGSGTINLNVGPTIGGNGESEVTINLTSTWTRYTVTGTLTATGGAVRFMIISRTSTTATTCSAWGAQLEVGPSPNAYTQTNAVLPTSKLLSLTKYTVRDLDGSGPGQPSGAETTYYTYDSHNNLRYAISAQGDVTQYSYDSYGRLTSTVQTTLPEVRTNLARRSQELDNSSVWVSGANGTGSAPVIAANAAVAPDGTTTAETVTFNTGSGSTAVDQSFIYQNFAAQSGALYAGSFWVQGPAGQTLIFRHAGCNAYTAVTLTGAWQHVSSVEAGGITGTVSFYIGLRQAVGFTLPSNVTVNLWGVQFEAGAFASSYIPTTTAAVTRNILSVSAAPTTAQFDTWFSGLDLSTAQRTDTAYDFRGNVVSTTSYAQLTTAGVGVTTSGVSKTLYIYDQAGKLLSQLTTASASATTAALNQTATVGRLTSTLPAAWQSYAYDGLGRLIAATDPNGKTTSTIYDDAYDATTQVFADGTVERDVYNLAGALVSTSHGAATGSNQVSPSNLEGELAAPPTLASTQVNAADDQGNVGVAADPLDVTSYFLTDSSGNKLAAIRADGTITEYAGAGLGGSTGLSNLSYLYNSMGRLSKVTNTFADASTAWAAYSYDGSSARVTAITRSDGSALKIAYVLLGGAYRVSSVQQLPASGAAQTTTVAYDASNRVSTITNPSSQVTTYGYDANSRVTSVALPGAGTSVFQYDSSGNRTLERNAAGNTITRTFDASNHVLTETRYGTPDPDGSGPLQPGSPSTTRYAYDANGRLRYVISPQGEVVQYSYNAAGQQTSRVDFGAARFNVSGLGTTTSPTQATMDVWVSMPNWQSAGTGDVDGNGVADLVLTNAATGDWGYLTSGASGVQTWTYMGNVSPSYALVGVGDLNGDGKADAVFRNNSTGALGYQQISNATSASWIQLPASAAALTLSGIADFNGDGKADFVWTNATTGDVSAWLMNGGQILSSGLVWAAIPLAWHIVGTGDFNGDGKADFLWRNNATGDVSIWQMNGLQRQAESVFVTGLPLDWHNMAIGDVDHDGKADIVWQYAPNSHVSIWEMNGFAIKSSTQLDPPDPNWQIQGVGDLNGDGVGDVLLKNATSGQMGAWLMSGAQGAWTPLSGPSQPDRNVYDANGLLRYVISPQGQVVKFSYNASGQQTGQTDFGAIRFNLTGLAAGVSPSLATMDTWASTASSLSSWQKGGMGDVDGDAAADLVLTNTATGDWGYLSSSMSGVQTWTYMGNVSPSYALIGLGDFNGDGKADVLFRNNSTTSTGYEQISSPTSATWLQITAGSPLPWTIAGIGDFNGDGKADIVWTNATTGEESIWLMNGAQQLSWGIGGTFSGNWSVVGTGDFNGDGKADLLWRNLSTGDVSIWEMNGTQMLGYQIFVTGLPLDWHTMAIGDVDHDGKADIVWQYAPNSHVSIWEMNGFAIKSSTQLDPPSSTWQIQGAGDLNRDGVADVLLKNASTGQAAAWMMNAGQATWLPFVGPSATTQDASVSGQTRTDTTYDAHGNVASVTTAQVAPNGTLTILSQTTYAYGADGSLISQTTMGARASNVATATDGSVRVNVLDSSGAVLASSRTNPPDPYSSQGGVGVAPDALDVTSYVVYDASGHGVARVGSDGGVTAYAGAGLGGSTSLSSLSYGYNALGQLVSATDSFSGGATVTATYSYTGAGGPVTAITRSDGWSLQITYTLLGGVLRASSITQTDAYGAHTTSIAYDASNRVSTITNPSSQVTTYGYDANSRVTSVTLPGNLTSVFQYDAGGNRILERDAAGNTIARTFDGSNHVLTETRYGTPDPDGSGPLQPGSPSTTRYVYDTGGLLRYVISSQGEVVQLGYSASGKQTSQVDFGATRFNLAPYSTTAAPSLATMDTWAGTLSALSTWQVVGIGDFNGDGISDVAYWNSTTSDWGYEALNTSGVATWNYMAKSLAYSIVAAGDLNGDGISDLLLRNNATGDWSYDLLNASGGYTWVQGGSSTPAYVVKGIGDVNGDGRGDVLMANEATGDWGFINLLASGFTWTGEAAYDLHWTVDAFGDFSGDGIADVQFRWPSAAGATGYGAMHPDGSLTWVGGIPEPGPTYKTIGTGDENGDGKADVFYLNTASPNDIKIASNVLINPNVTLPAGWQVVGVGDINGDHKADVILRNTTTGQTAAWLMNGAQATWTLLSGATQPDRNVYDANGQLRYVISPQGQVVQFNYNTSGQQTSQIDFGATRFNVAGLAQTASPSLATMDDWATTLANLLSWQTAGVGDFNGDGVSDIAYRNSTTGAWGYMGLSNSGIQTWNSMMGSSAWPIVGIGDFNADGISDIAMQDSVSGGFGYAAMHNNSFTWVYLGSAASTNQIVGAADLNSDGRADLMFRDSSTIYTGYAAMQASGYSWVGLGYASPAYTLGAVGDFNGDGVQDTLWRDDVGGAMGYVAMPSATWTTLSGPSTNYKVIGAGDENGDGKADLFFINKTGSFDLQVMTSGGLGSTLYPGVNLPTGWQIAGVGDVNGDHKADVILRNTTTGQTAAWLMNGAQATWTVLSGGASPATYDPSVAGQTRTDTTYDARGNVASVTTAQLAANGSLIILGQTTYAYDANGSLIGQTATGANASVLAMAPDGSRRATLFDAAGAVVSANRFAGGPLPTTSYKYDAQGNLRISTDPLGLSTYFVYDKTGRKTGQVLPDGSLTQYLYDANNNLVGTIAYATRLTSTQLAVLTDANGNPTSVGIEAIPGLVTSPADIRSWSVYDDAGRVAATVDGAGDLTRYAYDGKGQLVSTSTGERVDPLSLLQPAYVATTTSAVTGNLALQSQSIDASAWTAVRSTVDANTTTAPDGTQTADRLRATTAGGPYVYQAVSVTPNQAYTETVYLKADTAGWAVVQIYSDSGYRASRYVNLQTGALGSTWDSGWTTTAAAVTKAANGFWRVSLTTTPTTNLLKTSVQVAAADGQVGNVGDSIFVWGAQLVQTSTIDPSTAVLPLSALPPAPSADNTTRYFYDADGHQVAALDPDGFLTQTVYDSAGRKTQTTRYVNAADAGLLASGTLAQLLTSVGTSNVHETVAYDDRGLAISAVDGGLGQTTYVHDAFGRVTSMTEGYGTAAARTTTYAYDADGRLLTTVVDAGRLNLTTTDTYDVMGRLVAVTDPIGAVTRHVFDSLGNQVYAIDPTGHVTQTVYDLDNRPVQVIRLANVLGASSLTSLGLTPTPAAVAASISNGPGDRVTAFTYDAAGRVLSTTVDPGGSGHLNLTTTHAYDGAGHLLSVTDPAGYITRTVYDAAGRAAYAIDASGMVCAYVYDATGAVVKTTHYATAYTASGNPALSAMQSWTSTNTASTDRTTRALYDADGRLAFGIDAWGAVTAYAYDAEGRVTQQTLYAVRYTGGDTTLAAMQTWANSNAASGTTSAAGDEITHTVYDGAGRVIDLYDAMGVRTHYAYDGLGNVTDITVAYGTASARTSHNAYDTAGRLSSTTADYGSGRLNLITGYQYDADGRVIGIIDPNNHLTTNTYDLAGRLLTSMVDPGTGHLGLTTTTQYNAFGEAVKVTDPNGASSYAYYDAAGRLGLAVDAAGYAATTAYDADGNVSQVVRYITPTSGAAVGAPPAITANSVKDAVTNFGYDHLGRLTSTTDAEGNRTLFVLNAFGEQVYVVDALGDVSKTAYDADGRAIQVTRYATALGSSALSALGSSPTVAAVATVVASVPTSDIVTTYAYDQRGNRTQMVEASGLAEARTTNYVYDLDNRQISQSMAVYVGSASSVPPGSATVTATQSIQYDAFGNAVLTTDANGYQTYSYYDAANRKIAQVAVTNAVTTTDVNGNHTYSYVDRSTGLSQSGPLGTLTTFAYDGKGALKSTVVYKTAVAPTAAGSAPPTAPVNAAADQAGDQSQAKAGAYRETDYAYDAADRLTTTTQRDVQYGYLSGSTFVYGFTDIVTSAKYDADGHVIATQDGNGAWSHLYYDADGRKIAQVDPAGYVTTYQLDAGGNVLKQIQYATAGASPGNDPATVHVVGPLVLPSSSADDRITDATYDRNGRVLTQTREGVQASTVSGTGALTTASANSTVTYAYDGLGNVLSKTQATGDYTHYRYDAFGRLTHTDETAYVDYRGVSVTPSTDITYNGLGLVTQTVVHGDGTATAADRTTTTVYGAGGRVISVTDPTGFAQISSYDAVGNLVARQYGRKLSNGTVETDSVFVSYDSLNREISRKTGAWNGSAWTYGDSTDQYYDAYGEVVAQGVNTGGVQASAQKYADYDNAGRVWRSNMNDGASRAYAYDKNGNATILFQTTGALNLKSKTDLSSLFADTSGSITQTITVYDRRNEVTDTIQPSSSQSYTPVHAYQLDTIGQAASMTANYGGGAVWTGAGPWGAGPGGTVYGLGGMAYAHVWEEDQYAGQGYDLNGNYQIYYYPCYFLEAGIIPSVAAGGGTIGVLLNGVPVASFDSYSAGFAQPWTDITGWVTLVQNMPWGGQRTLANLYVAGNQTGSSAALPPQLQVEGVDGRATSMQMFVRPWGSNGEWAHVDTAYEATYQGASYFSVDMNQWPFSGAPAGASWDVRYIGFDGGGGIVAAAEGRVWVDGNGTPQADNWNNIAVDGPGESLLVNSGGRDYLILWGLYGPAALAHVRYETVSAINQGQQVWTDGYAANGGWGQNGLFYLDVTGAGGGAQEQFWYQPLDGGWNPIVGNLWNGGTFYVGGGYAWGTDSSPYLAQYAMASRAFTLNPASGAASQRVRIYANGAWSGWNTNNSGSPWSIDYSYLNSNFHTETGYGYEYQSFNASGQILSDSNGSFWMGYWGQGAGYVLQKALLPGPSNASYLKLYWRVANSGSNFNVSTINNIGGGLNGFVFDPEAYGLRPSSGSTNIEYYFDAYDAANNLIAPGNHEDHTHGNMIISANGAAQTDNYSLQWVSDAVLNSTFTVHRTQSWNAFGEVKSETDGRGDVTNLAYNTLGELVTKTSPQVTWYDESGGAHTTSTVETSYYDVSGRQVGQRDGNGNLTTAALLADSGYDGQAAQTVTEFDADGTQKKTGFDVEGEARTITTGYGTSLAATTTNLYDGDGNLIEVDHPLRAAGNSIGVQAKDFYGYDGLGQRITHTDSLYGSGVVETTDYDVQGRVTRTADLAGLATTYAYTWNSAISAPGLGTSGGWQKTTTNPSGRQTIEYDDLFSHVTWRQDFGGHQYSYMYNYAGQLTNQGGTSGQNIAYAYYANGYLASTTDIALQIKSTYEYDNDGNRIVETYNSIAGSAPRYYENAVITYDAMNRVVEIKDNRADITYKYDANGNRREIKGVYNDGMGGAVVTQDAWYKYDTMNRFVLTNGALSGGQIVAGTNGIAVTYDAAGNRHSANSEVYTYSADGYLENTLVGGVVTLSRTNDALGRTTTLNSYSTGGAFQLGRVYTYDRDNRITDETDTTGASVVTTIHNDYRAWNGSAYAGMDQGVLVHASSTTGGTTTNTIYTYQWWDQAEQAQVILNPTDPSTGGGGTPAAGFSIMNYDVNGHLKSKQNLGASQTVTYTSDANGQILDANQTITGTPAGDHQYYYFNGHRVGDLISGPNAYLLLDPPVDYGMALAQVGSGGKGDFRDPRPVDSLATSTAMAGLSATSYTTQTGDTLQKIASALWGDGSLWYLIADANGLSNPSTQLVAGMVLIIPNKVTSFHNNASTFTPYSPGQIIADTLAIEPLDGPLANAVEASDDWLTQITRPLDSDKFQWDEVGLAGIDDGSVVGAILSGGFGGPRAMSAGGLALTAGQQDAFDWAAVAMASAGGASIINGLDVSNPAAEANAWAGAHPAEAAAQLAALMAGPTIIGQSVRTPQDDARDAAAAAEAAERAAAAAAPSDAGTDYTGTMRFPDEESRQLWLEQVDMARIYASFGGIAYVQQFMGSGLEYNGLQGMRVVERGSGDAREALTLNDYQYLASVGMTDSSTVEAAAHAEAKKPVVTVGDVSPVGGGASGDGAPKTVTVTQDRLLPPEKVVEKAPDSAPKDLSTDIPAFSYTANDGTTVYGGGNYAPQVASSNWRGEVDGQVHLGQDVQQGGLFQLALGPTSYSTPGNNKFDAGAKLSASQISVASAILDYGRQGGYSDKYTQIVLNQAVYESGLGTFTGNPTNSKVQGIFQYDSDTWSYLKESGSISKQSDQIGAMFHDVSMFQNRYDKGISSGAIPKNVGFEQYVEVKHHGGPNSTAWYDYKDGYNKSVSSYGIVITPLPNDKTKT